MWIEKKKVEVGKVGHIRSNFRKMVSNIPINGPILSEKTRKIAKKLQITDSTASNSGIHSTTIQD